ncbi:MAG: hypothetical protein KGL39_49160 [Patescibacteria group bacterium]|nr:hypothetical protein [Patescibacteria group bacterium]
MPRETAKAAAAFRDYVSLGDGRSLTSLLILYQNRAESGPTRHLSTLKMWSSQFEWQERLREAAEREANAIRQRQQEDRDAIWNTGAADPHERVKDLKAAAEILKGQLFSGGDGSLVEFLTIDVKGQEKTISKNNLPAYRELRATWADIASEKGERTTIAVATLLNMMKDERSRIAEIISRKLAEQPELGADILAEILGDAPDVPSDGGGE